MRKVDLWMIAAQTYSENTFAHVAKKSSESFTETAIYDGCLLLN